MLNGEQFIKDLKEMLSSDKDINMETDLLDIDEWDSFSSVTFIAMAEEKYNKKIEPFSVAEAVLVEDLYNIAADDEG